MAAIAHFTIHGAMAEAILPAGQPVISLPARCEVAGNVGRLTAIPSED